jgi:glycosyltransferase involved in cell wall biosynthesis
MNSIEVFPLVSVVIPVFNGANYLEQAIESALSQDYPSIEILVVNDGSQDEGQTLAILERYKDRVRVFNKKNGGVASALNLGIRNMKGEFFSWLSHDDLYYSNKVSEEYRAYQSQRNRNAIIYSDYLVFSPENPSGYLEKMSKITPELFRYWLLTKSQLHGCTLFIPKSAFTECGDFDESLKTTQDYDMWFRMSEKYDFIYLDKCLVKFRVHPNQDSNKLKETALAECNVFYEKSTLQLTANEIISGSGLDLKTALDEMLANFQSRGWQVAAEKLSIKLGIQNSQTVSTPRPCRRLLGKIRRRIVRAIY